MIKHIVLFKMRTDIDAAEKQAKLLEIKSGLEALVGQVPTLRSIEVGLNCNPAEAFDMALVATADNMADLDAYAKHPKHVAMLQQIKAILEVRSCVDFEC